jgi:endonuclease I
MMTLLRQLTIIFCLSCLLLFTFAPIATAEEILTELIGSDLLSQIAQEYVPDSTLGYRTGRDILYTKIDNLNGEVRGIYTGMVANIDPNSNTPRKDATEQNINAEHIYPQSKGAKGTAKSDLHSLFPSRDRVNNSRGSNPFAEINDSLTRKWFRDDQELTVIPMSYIDEYSESIPSQNGLFEPRENKKGDVARAMFYFYTIYRFKADAEDANFFPLQSATLCRWHELDPVDSQELERSHKVAEYQGNENPFVIDSTLAQRTYCQ